MKCIDCYNFLQQRIDIVKFVQRFGADVPSVLFRRKLDWQGKAWIYWCAEGRLPRDYYCESDYLDRISLPGCKAAK